MTLELKNLREWFEASGGHIHSDIERMDNAGLVGIFATRPIVNGTSLVRVPENLLLKPSLIANYPEANQWILETELEQVVCVLLFELEKRQKSMWAPWFRYLPTLSEFKAYHPYFLPEDDQLALRETMPRIGTRFDRFSQTLDKIDAHTNRRFSRENIEWATILYLSRAFEGQGLVPGADLFNHCSRTGRALTPKKALETGQAYSPGDQVMISYGADYDTLDLWLSFGFHEQGPHVVGCYNLVVRPTLNHDVVVRKLQDLGCEIRNTDCGIHAVGHNGIHINDGHPSDKLIEFCRAISIESTADIRTESVAKTLRQLNRLVAAFSEEVSKAPQHELPGLSDHPALATGFKIIEERKTSLIQCRQWVHAKALQLVAA